MSPNQIAKPVLTTTALSGDGTQIVQTFTQGFTQVQINLLLSQYQNQLASLNTQISNVNVAIANLQSQLAMFKVVTPPITPSVTPGV